MAAFERVESGFPEVDKMLDNIRMGDNVVWRVSSLDQFRTFAEAFAKQAVKDGRILPARIGTGRSDAKNCTRRYQLSDILNQIAREKAEAQAQAQLIS